MTYKEQMQQANREARCALIGLVVTVVVWALSGLGVAQFGIYIGATPLWIITGCGGTFVCAIAVAVVLARVMGAAELDVDEGEEVRDE